MRHHPSNAAGCIQQRCCSTAVLLKVCGDVCVWGLELGGLSLTLNFLENCLFRVVCSPLLTSEGSLRMTGENCKLVVFVGALRLRDEKDSIQNRRTGWSIMCVVYMLAGGLWGRGCERWLRLLCLSPNVISLKSLVPEPG